MHGTKRSNGELARQRLSALNTQKAQVIFDALEHFIEADLSVYIQNDESYVATLEALSNMLSRRAAVV